MGADAAGEAEPLAEFLFEFGLIHLRRFRLNWIEDVDAPFDQVGNGAAHIAVGMEEHLDVVLVGQGCATLKTGFDVAFQHARADEQVLLAADIVRQPKDVDEIAGLLEDALKVAAVEVSHPIQDELGEFGFAGHLHGELLDAAEELRMLEDRAAGGGDGEVRPRFQLRSQRRIVEPIRLRPRVALQLGNGGIGCHVQTRRPHGMGPSKGRLHFNFVVTEECEKVAVPVRRDAQIVRANISCPDCAFVVDAAHVEDVDMQDLQQLSVGSHAQSFLQPRHHRGPGRHHHRHTVGLTMAQCCPHSLP